jgi:hypothetical protein
VWRKPGCGFESQKRSPVPSRLLLLIKEIENIKMPLDAGYFESPVRGKRTMMQIIVWVRILEIPHPVSLVALY